MIALAGSLFVLLCGLSRANHVSLVQHRALTVSDVMSGHVDVNSATTRLNPHILRMDMSQATVVENNLGGLGPTNGEKRIYFKNVAPIAGTYVDLEITNTSFYAGNTSKNGAQGIFGTINIDGGTSVDLLFRFLLDGKEFVIPRTSISFWDLDQGKDGGAETFTVGPISEYYVSPDSSVVASWTDDETWSFESSEVGSFSDNPIDFESMTSEQINRGVEVNMLMESDMRITFAASANNNGRTFMFAGASPLENMKAKPVGMCAQYTRLDFTSYTGGSPLSGMTFKGVATLPDDTKVDATLTADSSYEAADESKNGETGGLVDINLKGNVSSEITLKFTETIDNFFITFLDIDGPAAGNEILKIETSSYRKHYIFAYQNIAVKEEGGFTVVSSRKSGFEADNPTDRKSLTWQDLSFGVAFNFRNTDTVKFTYTADKAIEGRNILLTGVTNLACPMTDGIIG